MKAKELFDKKKYTIKRYISDVSTFLWLYPAEGRKKYLKELSDELKTSLDKQEGTSEYEFVKTLEPAWKKARKYTLLMDSEGYFDKKFVSKYKLKYYSYAIAFPIVDLFLNGFAMILMLLGMILPISGIIELLSLFSIIDIPKDYYIKLGGVILNPWLAFIYSIILGIVLLVVGIYLFKLSLYLIRLFRDGKPRLHFTKAQLNKR